MEMTIKDSTHRLKCRHAVGTHGMNYTMACVPLKDMGHGRLKVLVFGDRFWKGKEDIKRVRYVPSWRVVANER